MAEYIKVKLQNQNKREDLKSSQREKTDHLKRNDSRLLNNIGIKQKEK